MTENENAAAVTTASGVPKVDLPDSDHSKISLSSAPNQAALPKLLWTQSRGRIQEDVIGWILNDRDAATAAAARDLFEIRHFTNGTYALAFALATTMVQEGEVIAADHIALRLSRSDSTLAEDEALTFIRDCMSGAPRPANPGQALKWLKQAAADLAAALRRDREQQADELLKSQGIRAFADVTDLLREPETAVGRFIFTRFDDIVPTTACNYVVKDLIPCGLTVVWGPPKCGKSFWALDLALHIAQGWDYRGRRVVQGPVVYVALEGGSGYGARVEAFRRHHSLVSKTAADFHLLRARLDLAADQDALIAAIRSQLGSVSPICIYIDTLNRSLGGSESSDADMGVH